MKIPQDQPPPQQPTNDVHSEKFESKIDPYFTIKAKEKDHWTRRTSIKIQGQWI